MKFRKMHLFKFPHSAIRKVHLPEMRTCVPADQPMGKLRTTKMRTLRNQTPNERCVIMCISLQ